MRQRQPTQSWRMATGSPLDVEADDEAVNAVDVEEPEVDHLGSMGDEGLDMVGLESDFEEVVGVLVHFISSDCISSDCDFNPPLSLCYVIFFAVGVVGLCLCC